VAEEDATSVSSLQDFLQPLQDTADRVSQQVEAFARLLHKFKNEQPATKDDLWTGAWELFGHFSEVAGARHDHLASKRSRSPRSNRGDRDHDSQLRKISLERDLWILNKNLLLCQAPKALEDAGISQAHGLKDLNQYSSNPDIWNAFLDADVVAQELEATLVWLQERAIASDAEMKEKIDNTKVKAERGDIKSAVPFYTKDEIKNRKRLLAHTGPLDAMPNGLSSHLDPDAPTRQQAQLDDRDQFHEEAAWQTCWEMLRRGMKLSDIRAWWNDENEPFRSALLCPPARSPDSAIDSPFRRIMNMATNTQWLKLCRAVANDSVLSEREQRAVFGLLCGDVEAANQNCANVDDFIFNFVNAQLIQRYLHYVDHYRYKLQDPKAHVYQSQPKDRRGAASLIHELQTMQETKEELKEPHKFLELALLHQDYDNFFLGVGFAAGYIAKTTGRFTELIDHNPNEKTVPADTFLATAADEDAVRIIAHLQIVLRDLAFLDEAHTPYPYVVENNIVNYIGHLQEAKKLALIPLYSSKLSKDRCQEVLGITMIDVTDNDERSQLARLIRKNDINLADTIFTIAVTANSVYRDKMKEPILTAQNITERPEKEQFRLRSEFMMGTVSEQDDRSISSLEWYRFIDADNWGRACFSIALLYKAWLIEGNFAALKALAARVDLREVSMAAVNMNLTFGSESEEEEDAEGDQSMGDSEDADGVRSPRKRRANSEMVHPLTQEGTSRGLLYGKSHVWLQLEQLTHALIALEQWQVIADEVNLYVPHHCPH
jgi:nuclear pore complex protein Nup107